MSKMQESNGIKEKFFTKKNPEAGDIKAAFFISNYDRKLGNRLCMRNANDALAARQ